MSTHDGLTMAGGMGDGGKRQRSLWKTPAAISAVVVLLTLLGNHFVDGWNWKPQGFALAGILVFSTALTYELVTRKMNARAYRAAVGIALATAFVLFWGNVVQFVDGVNRSAVMYLLVPLVGVIGAALARFRPTGMSRALFATALAQALALTIALSRNPPVTSWTPAVTRGFVFNALCVMLFAASALLFRTAARAKSEETDER